VVVVGGGLAGLSLAAALGTAGVPVVSIEREAPERQARPGYDLRTTAISFSSRRILAGAGIWPHLEPEAGAILEIRVADQSAPWFVHYDHTEVGDQPLGWIIDNAVIRRGLEQRLAQLPGVTRLAPAVLQRLERTEAGTLVTLADGRQLRAQLVVGADGRGSLCRRSAGIRVLQRDYHQSAIVCTIGHQWPHHGVALERFLPAGPFAVLPMTGNRSSIVWSERTRLTPSFLALPEAAFLEELRQRVGDHLGELQLLGERAAYPLSLQWAERHTDTRLALVGEAAHAIHPVAGQGLNLGLRDVAVLAEVVVDQFRLGRDLGAAEVLARYQRWRHFDNLLMTAVCDGLVQLFSNDLTPLRLARQWGFGVVNQVAPLKRFLMRHAMGMVGDLPRLIRGEKL